MILLSSEVIICAMLLISLFNKVTDWLLYLITEKRNKIKNCKKNKYYKIITAMYNLFSINNLFIQLNNKSTIISEYWDKYMVCIWKNKLKLQ